MHQDDNEDVENLDCWAKENIMADKQANAHLQRVMRQDAISSIQSYQNKGWTLQIGNKPITRHFEKQLIYHCTKTDIKWYWCDRFDIDLDRMQSIDWKVFIKTSTEMIPPKITVEAWSSLFVRWLARQYKVHLIISSKLS